MLISSLSTTLLQIFCKISLNYYDIVLNSIDPYDISGGTSNMNRLRYYLSITLFEELCSKLSGNGCTPDANGLVAVCS